MNKNFLIAALLLVFVFLGAGCNPFAKEEPKEETPQQIEEQVAVDDKDYGDAQMAEDTALSNPATVYCLSQDGEFTMKKTLAGTTEGYCDLPDGTECEVWALYKGECGDIEEPEEEEEDIATSTDDVVEDDDTSTSTIMVEEDTEEPEEEIDNESADDSEQVTDSEKKKKTGDIDIAVKPGEEAGEIIMSWDTHDLSAPNGYIVMLSGDNDITYPTKYYHELDREESYAFTWVDLSTEKEYYFRVCIKKGDGCGTYSPIISTYARSEDSE